MGKQIRLYQQEAIDSVFKYMDEGGVSGIITLATGLGKTFVAVNILNNPRFNKVLWLTHSEELIEQSSLAILKEEFDEQSLFEEINQKDGFIAYLDSLDGKAPMDLFDGLTHQETRVKGHLGIIKQHRLDTDCKIVVASVQTIVRRLDKLPKDLFDLVVVDECHMACSNTFTKVCNHFKGQFLLGLTATPVRTDGMSLSNLFDKIIIERDIKFGIDNNYLCEIDAVRVKTDLDIDSVRTTAGELNSKDLENLVNTSKRNNLIVDKYLEYGSGRQALAFCVDVKHAMDLAQVFNNRGINASFVVGDESLCPDRKSRVDLFRSKDIQVLTNVNILTAGVDIPDTNCIIAARPTKSLVLYCLDSLTEILTKDGWKTIDTIKKSDKVAAYDKYNAQIWWLNTTNIIKRKREVDEQMYSIQLPGIDIRVSDKHRMLRSRRFGRKHTYLPYEFVEAKDFNTDCKIPVSGIQHSKGLPLTNWELYFLGLFLSDGNINKGKNQMFICQSAHQPWNKEIVECLENCGFTYRLSTVTRKTQFSESSTMNYYYLGVKQFKHLLPWIDKNLNKNYEDITPFQFEWLIAGLNLGDGSKSEKITWTRRTYQITTGNNLFADNIQSLAVRKGFRCNISNRFNPTFNSVNYQIQIEPYKLDRKISFGNDGRDQFKKEEFWKDEMLWCVSNKLETIVIRRNGKVSIVGNCQSIGRGTRLKSDGGNLLLLDIVDNTSKHQLINTWTLDKGKPLEDKVFMTKEKKSDLIEKREQKRKIDSQVKKDVKVDLMKLPKPPKIAGTWMKDAPSEKQLAWLERLGYDIVNNTYTKGQCSELISASQASQAQINALKHKGYDVSQGVTVTQAQMAFAAMANETNKSITKSL